MAPKGRVFLCHNSREKDAIKPLVMALLSSFGVRTWLDTWEIPGGDEWEQHIRREFAASWSCLVFLGAHGFGPFQREEIAWAKERKKIDPDYRVIPVLLPGARDEQLADLDTLLSKVHWVDLRKDENVAEIALALRGDAPGPPVQALSVARNEKCRAQSLHQ